MIKIFISCRNRLSITCKAITALYKHSTLPHQIYVFDNLTNFKISEHFMYFSYLYEKGIISQYTMNTKESTFNAFSKASSFNQFGLNHEQDPDKDKYDFLVCLDNDMIVMPGWDLTIKKAWGDIKNLGLNNIKIITQAPGGIMQKKDFPQLIAEKNAIIGRFGGSGFWTFRPDFFRDIGFLNLKQLENFNKKHDQHYWKLLEKSTGGKDYILGLKDGLSIHCGRTIIGSVCDKLTATRNNIDLIKFEKEEERIDSLTFDEFYKIISKDSRLMVW